MRSIVFAEQLIFPESVHDLASFRDWVKADDFPEKARVSYLDGDFWVDLPMERIGHNLCKKAIANLQTSESILANFWKSWSLIHFEE